MVKLPFNSSKRCRRKKKELLSCACEENNPVVRECEELLEFEKETQLQSTKIPGVAIITVFLSIAIFTYYINEIPKDKDEDDDINLVPPNPIRPLPPSGSTMHFFQKAAVCADGPPCAEIGRDILLKNGSAVDATIAALFCNGIVNMQSMGLGGGFLMTIYIRKEKKSYSLNARETAPLEAKSRMYQEHINDSSDGPLAIGVPGELKGYWAAHQKFGKLSWKELIAPSIKLCENGYNMSHHQYWSLFKNKVKMNDANFGEWFRYANGSFKRPGSKIIPKRLCQTLRIIAKNGADDFYVGNLSKMLVKDIEEAGGIITAEDLEQYQIEWQESASFDFENGYHLYSAPPPGSGVLVGFILNILEGYDLSSESLMSIQSTVLTYHRMIEAFKFAYAKRAELGDPNFINMTKVLKNLYSRKFARKVRSKIVDNSTSSDSREYGAIFLPKEDHGTAHLSVIAPNGDAVSVTSSINIYFGAGITSKQTGIVFNSIMNDFSFPDSTNYYGLAGSPKNRMQPGKRPFSSMAPSIVTDRDGDVKMVIGAAGGSKITTTVAQAILRALWFRETVKEVVDAPRIHHQLYPMHVEYEYGTLKQVVDGLRAFGHKLRRSAGSIVCALLRKGNYIVGNADHRKGGEVFGIT